MIWFVSCNLQYRPLLALTHIPQPYLVLTCSLTIASYDLLLDALALLGGCWQQYQSSGVAVIWFVSCNLQYRPLLALTHIQQPYLVLTCSLTIASYDLLLGALASLDVLQQQDQSSGVAVISFVSRNLQYRPILALRDMCQPY